jgi:glycosyltransferase involved in cell wall biosynthesis
MDQPNPATTPAQEGNTPSLSVVIIGRNEGQRLARCIASLGSIEAVDGAIEVIYVDSGSVDGSAALAAAAGARVFDADSPRPTAAFGRNIGWRAARAELVLFLDGDTILHPAFPRRALDAIAQDLTIAAVWGHRREIHCERSLYNRVLDLDWVFAPGFTEYCGGDVLMRRSALLEVDGYDSALIAGEEPELCRRLRSLGHRILHIDAPMTGHDLAMLHFSQYCKRALRAGHAYAEVSRRFRDTADPFWGPQRRQNLIRGGFWSLSLISAIACTLLFRSLFPIALWMMLLLVLAARSAWLARWKSRSMATLFLYGVHSHLQQIPILVGQLQFARDADQGTSRKLIEYKSKEG